MIRVFPKCNHFFFWVGPANITKMYEDPLTAVGVTDRQTDRHKNITFLAMVKKNSCKMCILVFCSDLSYITIIVHHVKEERIMLCLSVLDTLVNQ